MAVGGFPTPDNPQSGVFNEVAAKAIGKVTELTVLQFRYWKPGRKLVHKEKRKEYHYIVISIPTVPAWQVNWTSFHFSWYPFFIRTFLHKELKQYDLVHCVQGEIGVWFSKIKKHYNWKLLTQFIGTDLVSELHDHRNKPWIVNWQRKLDGASFNSNMLAELFNNYYPDFQGKSTTIYRGVDLSKFQPEHNQEKEFRLLYLGGLANYKFKEGRNLKGGIDLLEAWTQVSQKGLDRIQLRFGGPDAVDEVIEKLCDPRDLKNFIALGPLRKKEVIEEYHKADCVIIPSRQDGLPNVSVEAQACGKPVIGARVGGIPESVRDNHTGFLFEAGNIPELTGHILEMAQNEDNYKRFSINARAHIEAHFNSENFVQHYFNFYKKICAE